MDNLNPNEIVDTIQKLCLRYKSITGLDPMDNKSFRERGVVESLQALGRKIVCQEDRGKEDANGLLYHGAISDKIELKSAQISDARTKRKGLSKSIGSYSFLFDKQECQIKRQSTINNSSLVLSIHTPYNASPDVMVIPLITESNKEDWVSFWKRKQAVYLKQIEDHNEKVKSGEKTSGVWQAIGVSLLEVIDNFPTEFIIGQKSTEIKRGDKFTASSIFNEWREEYATREQAT